MKNIYIYLLIIFLSFTQCNTKIPSNEIASLPPPKITPKVFESIKALTTPTLDGISNDKIWEHIKWQPIDQFWKGSKNSIIDFSGDFKLSWTPEGLYFLIRIKDDVFSNSIEHNLKKDQILLTVHASPTIKNSPTLKYYLDLDKGYKAVSMNPSSVIANEHMAIQRYETTDYSYWECKLVTFDTPLTPNKIQEAMLLHPGITLDFSVSYIDYDPLLKVKKHIGSTKDSVTLATYILKESPFED